MYKGMLFRIIKLFCSKETNLIHSDHEELFSLLCVSQANKTRCDFQGWLSLGLHIFALIIRGYSKKKKGVWHAIKESSQSVAVIWNLLNNSATRTHGGLTFFNTDPAAQQAGSVPFGRFKLLTRQPGRTKWCIMWEITLMLWLWLFLSCFLPLPTLKERNTQWMECG